MPEKEIYINSLKTNYKIAGSGPVVLILHGWGGSSDSWTAVQKTLAGKGFEIICPDLPGFGKSLTPPNAWGLTDYMKWVADFIDFLGIKRVFLIGHSFGGRIAVKFASNYPERVVKLVLCDSAGIKFKPGLKTRVIFLFARIGNALFAQRHLARLKSAARNLFYLFLRHHDYVKADGTMKKVIKKVLMEDIFPDLPKIRAKTLIVWGKSDKMVPLKYAYIFKNNVKNSKLKILPKIGHSPHLEVPEKLSQQILEFFLDKG